MEYWNWADLAAGVAGLLAVFSTLIGGWLSRAHLKETNTEHKLEVEAIASAVKAVTPTPMSGERREEEWEVVRNLVNEYHNQALSQARIQFWFSVIAASSGFLIIIVAIVMAVMQQTSAMQTTLQVIPGIAIEAVAALFFKQAAETRERATALYDRLRTDRERTYALALVDTIDNDNIRNAIKAELALHMSGLSQTHLLQRLIESFDLKLEPEAIVRRKVTDAEGTHPPSLELVDKDTSAK